MTVALAWQRREDRQVVRLPIAEIAPNPWQPRKEFDEHSLMTLAASIRRHGLLQPVSVRACDGRYELVMGERRLRACALLGMKEIDALVLTMGREQSAVAALVENLQRESLHYLEEAQACAKLLYEGMTQEALAAQLGRSVSFVANKSRLTRLPESVRDYLIESGLSERHARALLPLKDESAMLRVARLSHEKALTVRETERLVARAVERLPVMPDKKRRVISRVGDYRLYLNAVEGVVRQMTEVGLPASIATTRTKDGFEVVIRIGV